MNDQERNIRAWAGLLLSMWEDEGASGLHAQVERARQYHDKATMRAILRALGELVRQPRYTDLPRPRHELEELAAYYDARNTADEMDSGEWVMPRVDER